MLSNGWALSALHWRLMRDSHLSLVRRPPKQSRTLTTILDLRRVLAFSRVAVTVCGVYRFHVDVAVSTSVQARPGRLFPLWIVEGADESEFRAGL
jgi:hypothetical protein